MLHLGAAIVIALAVLPVQSAAGQHRVAHISAASIPARWGLQLEAPVSNTTWPDIRFTAVQPRRGSIDALRAIQVAERAFKFKPGGYFSRVRYARLLAPTFHQPKSSQYVWLVAYEHDYGHYIPGPRPRYWEDVAVIDAITVTALEKFFVPVR